VLDAGRLAGDSAASACLAAGHECWSLAAPEPRRCVVAGSYSPCADAGAGVAADADRQAYAAISSACSELVCSFSRCDAAGRHATASALLWTGTVEHREWNAPALHAVSEADRLFGCLAEFGATPQAVAAQQVWRDWHGGGITRHDGLIRAGHPARIDSARAFCQFAESAATQSDCLSMEVRNEVASTRCDELRARRYAVWQASPRNLAGSVGTAGSRRKARSSSAQRHSALQQALAAVASRWEAARAAACSSMAADPCYGRCGCGSTLNLVMAAYRREVLCRSGLWWRKEWRSECPFGT
jgi:hypothetical protein